MFQARAQLQHLHRARASDGRVRVALARARTVVKAASERPAEREPRLRARGIRCARSRRWAGWAAAAIGCSGARCDGDSGAPTAPRHPSPRSIRIGAARAWARQREAAWNYYPGRTVILFSQCTTILLPESKTRGRSSFRNLSSKKL